MSAALIARRRRVLALVMVGLLAVTAIAVVVATSGGGSSTRARVGTTGPRASAPQRASKRATGTVPSSGQPTPTSTPLRVTLPASGKLSIGDSGSAVVALQKALILLGYKLGSPDGNFGSMTQAALASLQSTYGLTPDGIVGAATAAKLNQLLGSRATRG